MSVLVKIPNPYSLPDLNIEEVIQNLKVRLEGRVIEAFVFGSIVSGPIHEESDIDLILIKETQVPFVQRGSEFTDLFEVFPAIDILVYTPQEFSWQLDRAEVGFWKSVKKTLRKIL